MVFLGGCATCLLLTDPATPPPRVTYDVDVIVETASLLDIHKLSEKLIGCLHQLVKKFDCISLLVLLRVAQQSVIDRRLVFLTKLHHDVDNLSFGRYVTFVIVMEKDFRGLKKLRETAGERFSAGVVVYDGEHVASFGEKLYAVPIRALWETM